MRMLIRRMYLSETLKITLLVLLLAAVLCVVAIGLRHISALVPVLLLLAFLGALIFGLCREKVIHGPLRLGCIILLLLLPWVVYQNYFYFTVPRPTAPRLVATSRGETRIIATPYSIVTSWEVLDASVRRPAAYTLILLSHDRHSEIIMRIYGSPNLVSGDEIRGKVAAVAKGLQAGEGAFSPVLFRSLNALTHSRNVSRSSELPNILPSGPTTEGITVAAWNGDYMVMVTGCPAGNTAAKQSLDRQLATFVANE